MKYYFKDDTLKSSMHLYIIIFNPKHIILLPFSPLILHDMFLVIQFCQDCQVLRTAWHENPNIIIWTLIISILTCKKKKKKRKIEKLIRNRKTPQPRTWSEFTPTLNFYLHTIVMREIYELGGREGEERLGGRLPTNAGVLTTLILHAWTCHNIL